MRWIPAILLTPCLFGAIIIEEYKIVPDPAEARVRPGETLVLQIRAYGRIEKDGEQTRQGRLEPGNFRLRVLEPEGGWLSKSFRFQGKDDETIEREHTTGWKAAVFEKKSQYTMKDSTLYTAPRTPGKYTVEVTTTSAGRIVTAQQIIEVTEAEASRWVNPERTFSQEPVDRRPYRKLAERYAPYIAQETWFHPRADYLHRFDYDGDWEGDNNWENLDKGSPQAFVYYAAMETSTHWFLHYNFFHARDYSDNCIVGTCHENDNEGVILTIKKDGSEFGRLEIMETLAHNNVYTYTNRRDLRRKLHNVDGPLEVMDQTHPIVFLEAGGHGAIGGGDRKSFYDARRLRWKMNTGITYKFKGVAEIPQGGMDSDIGYELLSIYDHWWTKHEMRDEWTAKTFSDFKEYRPYGNRPRPKNPVISHAFYGLTHDAHKARPFWGWFDMLGSQRRILAPGQWALDPAYSIFQSLAFPRGEAWSMDYIYNPYLGFDEQGQ